MFSRKTVEQLVARMIRWGRGTSKDLTDFRPGSKIRTIYEAVALVVEDLYDHIYRTLKTLIEDNIYAIFGFDKISSVHATGLARFARTTIADRDYPIPSGTLLQSVATGAKQSINYRTTRDAVLLMGTTAIEVPLVCEMPGEIGNTGANSITLMPSAPSGIDTVTNPTALTNGQEEETKEAQKARFQRFIQANARAVLPSIEYGATLGEVQDGHGVVVERVVQAKAFEDLPNRLGEVDVYLWNGVDGASIDLLYESHKHITGYYDANGTRVYGYKSAGIWLNMYVANLVEVHARAVIKTANYFAPSEAQMMAEREIDNYFADLKMGQTVVQTAIESNIKSISGIYDVKLYLSTDGGTTYHTDNIECDGTSIALIRKPIVFDITSLPEEYYGDISPFVILSEDEEEDGGSA